MTGASGKIAAGNMDLSRRTGRQAALLEESADSMEQDHRHRAPECRQRGAGQPTGQKAKTPVPVREPGFSHASESGGLLTHP
jgi:hypothetical protein